MNPYFRTHTLLADVSREDNQVQTVDLAAGSGVVTMEKIPWPIKRSLVTEFSNRRGEQLLRFANEAHGWILRACYPYKVTLSQKIKGALVLPTFRKPLQRTKTYGSQGISRSIDYRIRSLSNAVFVQAYLLELEKAFEEAFRTENSAPVYALLLEELPVADPESLAIIRGDANVETNVRAQIFDFAEVCLSPFSIPLAQQSIKWLLKEKTNGDSWFVQNGDGGDTLLAEYVEGGWKLPAESFTALPSTRIERFIRRIEGLSLSTETALLNQLRIWFAAVTTYHLNKGLVRKTPRWEIGTSLNGGNSWDSPSSGWTQQNQTTPTWQYNGTDNWSWNSFRNLTELTSYRRQRLQDFFRRIARKFPDNQSSASIMQLQELFVQLARLDSGNLGTALICEAAAESNTRFLRNIIARYPLARVRQLNCLNRQNSKFFPSNYL